MPFIHSLGAKGIRIGKITAKHVAITQSAQQGEEIEQQGVATQIIVKIQQTNPVQ